VGHLSRRALLLGSGAVVGWVGAKAFAPALTDLTGTRSLQHEPAPGTLNDASLLSETPVSAHVIVTEDPGEVLVDILRSEMRAAAAEGRSVNIGAARHSMGGQAIPRGGRALTLKSGFVEVDSAAQTYRVQAGVRWHQVIAALDPLGLSPKVMQSNNDFGVAATFCVNAHGWPAPLGPMGATVRSIDLLVPSGDLVTCSRTENPDLFGRTMGGYGLTGLITEMVVEAAPNANLVPTFTELPAVDFAAGLAGALAKPDLNMVYGRLNVDRARFFQDALLIDYVPDADQDDIDPASTSGALSKVSRHIFRGQLGRERVKRARWWVETALGPKVGGGVVTRNSLINEPVITLDDRDPARTDILHEYFVAPDRFGDFLTLCQTVIPASYQELLNVTLRYVAADPESWLSYAPQPRIAAVMLFSQEMTARAEADMARMTRALIDGIIAIGGTYYLPYRPHASVAQLRRAYPRAPDFALEKRALDPANRLRNNLWDSYLRHL
jgi:FAD/FMN-containing dehydrogenase